MVEDSTFLDCARMADHGVQAVADFRRILEEALKVKQTITIEPALNKSDLVVFFDRVSSVFPPTSSPESKKPVIETAARDAFNDLLVSRSRIRANGHTSDDP